MSVLVIISFIVLVFLPLFIAYQIDRLRQRVSKLENKMNQVFP